MTLSWPKRALSEVATVIGRGIPPKYADEGMLVLNQKCVRDGRVDLALGRFHAVAEKAVPAMKRIRLGDVLVNSTGAGTLGRTAGVKDLPGEMTADSHITIVRANEGTHSGWLAYALRMSEGQIEAMAKGSTGQTELSRHLLAELTLSCPPLDRQRGIAEVLGALDDKIAANATLVTTADELSRLTFESLLSEGQAVPLSSLARFVNGRAFTKGATGSGRVVIRIAELNSGLGGSTVYNDIEVADDHVARPGDLLFAWSGSLTVHRWFRPEGIVNQHIFKVIPSDVPMWVVKGALDRKLSEFRAIAADKATTMGHIQRRHLDELVAVPSSARIGANDQVMNALWLRALTAEQESLQLEALRDQLLPQLMLGKIRVKDAERAVGEVV